MNNRFCSCETSEIYSEITVAIAGVFITVIFAGLIAVDIFH